jgi:hypothetical protein
VTPALALAPAAENGSRRGGRSCLAARLFSYLFPYSSLSQFQNPFPTLKQVSDHQRRGNVTKEIKYAIKIFGNPWAGNPDQPFSMQA